MKAQKLTKAELARRMQEIIVAVLLVVVALLFVGIALHAARDPKERGQPRDGQ